MYIQLCIFIPMKKNSSTIKANKLKKTLRHRPLEEIPTAKDYLSTGSTLLNLALTGNPAWGYLKGHYYLFTGDTSSGKTWLALSALAEAANNPNFDEYRLIYDDVERGALMNKLKFFGKKMVARLEPPKWVDDAPSYSYWLEDFYFNVMDALEDDRPFIYVEDSMDSLTSEQEVDKFEEKKKAREDNKETTGIMTDGKAKINSQNIRQLITPLHEKKSILLTIHQTRQRIGMGAMFQPKDRSGGNAPGFYAGIELWSKVVGSIRKHVLGKDRQIGTLCEIRTKKNRIQGKDRSVIVPILWSMGIDDTGACVDYLVEEGRWHKKKGMIEAPDLDFEGSREKLIRHIEKQDLVRDVREYVTDLWEEIEQACEVHRKPRYE